MNKNYVDAVEFERVIQASGLAYKAQKGFVKVMGREGRNVYVASTKRVGRVDVSGFEMLDPDGKALPGFVRPHCGEFGNVKQQLDFSLDQEAILQNFAALLEHMKGLEPAVRKPRPIGQTKPAPAGWTSVGKTPEEQKADRKALIERVAREKGAQISEKTKKELGIAEA